MRRIPLWVVPVLVACHDDPGTGPSPLSSGCAADGSVQQPATLVKLEPGESAVFLTSAVAATCLEIEPQPGSRYILSVLNVDPDGRSTASVQVLGGGRASVLSDRVARAVPEPPSGAAALRAWLIGTPEHQQRTAERLHLELLRADRRMVQRRGGPAVARARSIAARRDANRVARAATAASFDPRLNDTLAFNIRDIRNDLGDTVCVRGFSVRARAVYIGARAALFEDLESPARGRMDAFFQKIGAEFDRDIYPMLLKNFGDPLAYDVQLGGKGKVLMLFSPVINEKFQGLAGFVSGCDFYPRDSTPGPEENTVGNDAAIFYAYVPPDGSPGAMARWQGFVRGVLAHESKHLSSYAAKFARGATALEEPWLEEATAQLASEIYQRTFSHAVWKQPASFSTSVGCEPPLTVVNGCSGDHPQVMLHHFNYLYEYLDRAASEGPIGRSNRAIYGGAWSFVRWVVDQYATSEAGLLFTMTQSTSPLGVDNLVSRVHADFGELVANWSLATAVAADPAFLPLDARLTIPSWKQGEIFLGMHDQLVLASSGRPAFPLAYPLTPDSISFGAFDVAISSLRGGGAAFLDLRSPGADRQQIEIRSPSNTPLPANSPIRTAIVRVR